MSEIALQPLLSVPEVATILHVGNQTAYRLVREGHLPSVKVGGQIRVRPEDLAAMLERPVVVRVPEEEGPE